MKTLHKMVVKDTQYLMYFLKKNKNSIDDYKYFCSSEEFSDNIITYIQKVSNDYSIDLYPYLYTIKTITKTEFNGFFIYYIQHASSVDIKVDKVLEILKQNKNTSCNNTLDVFLSILKIDSLILISILSVMQYYFI